MRFLTSIGFSRTSKPATVALPEVGGRKQVRTRMVVVFPAPLGPRKPTICPLSTSNEILSTATVRAYRLVRPSTLIIWCVPDQTDVEVAIWAQRRRARMSATNRIPMKFHNTEGGEVLSNERRDGPAQKTYLSPNAMSSKMASTHSIQTT